MSQSHHESPVARSSDDKNLQTNQQQDDNASIHAISMTEERLGTLTHIPSHVSHTHDAPIQHYTSYVEIPDEIYDRLPHLRKLIIVALLSFCGFLAPISSTTILSAVPEVAATYKSTGTIINLSNALYSSYSRFLFFPFSGEARSCSILASPETNSVLIILYRRSYANSKILNSALHGPITDVLGSPKPSLRPSLGSSSSPTPDFTPNISRYVS